MRKYIIDTDIGDDIDDAFALDLALRTNLDLVAVTTVYRNTVDRARMAKRMISLYGKDIPVYFGYGATLDGKNESFPLCQWTKEIESDKYLPNNKDCEEAVDIILENARKYGKDFVLLAIGPLTNVAKAILKEPETMKNSGGIILMGGDYVNDYAEWNIICDVTAASIVFSSGVDIIAFGHEMTSQVRVSEQQQQYLFNLEGSEYREYLSQIAKLWIVSKEKGYRIILHDLLVIRQVLESDYCVLKDAKVRLETQDKSNRGKMILGEGNDFNKIKYATKVDPLEFIDYYLKKIG